MLGILVEKPSAGQAFAKALGGMRGTYNGEQYVIAASHGHLYEFVDPEKQVPAAMAAQYKSWDLRNLPWNEKDFSWKRTLKSGAQATAKSIKTTLSACDEIVIATDVDPTGEGELLAWEVLDELKLRPRKFSRMFFPDEAPKSIQTAFVTRKPIASMMADMDYVKAYYRARFDYLTMQFTRIATKHGDGQAVLRQGRLKSAMVLLVGDALTAVSAYKKVPFYQNRFRDENGNMFTNPDEPLFPDKSQVPKTYTTSPVVVDKKENKTSGPPDLLDLAGLSSILSGKGVKAKDVLAVYQKMYEANIVSYPRTEDKTITPEQFNEMLPNIDKIARVVGIDPAILTHRTPRKTHVKTGGAHGANRPGPVVPQSLDALKAYGSCAPAIYELLARNYLATLAEDYEYESQKGHLERYPAFVGSVNIPRKPGWKAVFSDMEEDDGDDTGKGLGTTANPFIHEGFPPKPPQPTMKWLMKQLKTRDVGTGATRTSIYAEVTNEKAKYPLLIEKRGKLTMSEFGEMSYRLLPGTHIGDLSTTERLQADMRDIVAGKADPEACLARVRQMVIEDMATMEKNGAAMRKELGKTMADIANKEYCNGTWGGKQIKFNRVWRGHRFTDAECTDLLAGKEIEVHGLPKKDGSGTYGVTGKLTNQTYNGHAFIGFEQTGFANKDGVPDSWSGHKFTDDEKLQLEQGLIVELKDCVSKKTNKTYECRVRYGERSDGTKGIIPDFSADFDQ